jgi:serine/threonine-protein kinase
MTEAAAEQALDAAGLAANSVETFSDTVAAGSVVMQAPAAGASVAPDTEILLFVSAGPAPDDITAIAVPNVTGMTADAAEGALQDAGFTVERLELPNSAAAGTVFDQLPAAGEERPEGSSVAILISAGP